MYDGSGAGGCQTHGGIRRGKDRRTGRAAGLTANPRRPTPMEGGTGGHARTMDKGRAAYCGIRCWLGMVVLMAVVALGATSTWGQSIKAGSLELTLAAGGGGSLPKDDLDTVTSFHVLPHIGYFITDELGEGPLRGNLEVLFEPTIIHLDASPSATVGGGAILPRWLFGASPRVRPFIEAGAGIVAGQVDLRETNCDVNFLLEAGVGAMIFLT